MSYKIYSAMSRPDQHIGELVDWEARVPSLHRRSHISGVFKRGDEQLDPAEAPTVLRINEPAPATQHAFTSSGGIHVIRRALRDLFEEMDPGTHQFLPITVTDRKGQAFGEWYILNVQYRQDTAYDDPADVKNEGGRSMAWLQDRSMTVDPSRQSGVNLWRETRFPSVCVISDRLHDELKRRGMKFFKTIKLNNRAD
ncbi:MAG: hypothetical protein QM744_10870 [Mesorhizobium sp.]